MSDCKSFWLLGRKLLISFEVAILACFASMGSQDRRKADPSLAVCDLEEAVQSYFDDAGIRNLGILIEQLRTSGINWKTAAKVISRFVSDALC